MRTPAPVRAVLLALTAVLVAAGCGAVEPAPRPNRSAPVIWPEGYTEPAVHSPPVRACPDPGRSLSPAGLEQVRTPTLNRIRNEDKRFVVGVSQTAPLFSRRDLATGELVGFEVDIVRRIARELFGEPLQPDDSRLRLVTMPTGSRLFAVDTAKNREARKQRPELGELPNLDMVIADVSITCGRVDTYGLRYSAPYLTTTTGLMVRTGDHHGVNSPDDLGGRKICSGTATTNSDEMIEFRDRQRAAGKSEVVPVSVNDTSECLMLLQRGLVDAIYTDVLILEGFRLQDPTTVLLDYRAPSTGEAGIAFSDEDQDLVRFVNGVLDRMRADGSLAAAYEKWFGTVPGRKPIPASRYLDP
ncbi:transporter substrate-binding domain-containing protein [Actinokineospora globicatena]|uniref:transporter substrate-binding domain-containing protein n=1 Tax=Actinokineospora globicatena TaxID=103729 RepID=UPI0020A58B1C|nr:transporter substrate-binding domain-containing protein [Actinokineospora globicatena]MCP2305872.1 polar amino acid transport system substrate-binding protein [Actinokineospora globicatena]GLW80259.1 putative glutamine-binding protein GlnH [Actinokineospora globicatena]GLW87088.1 putative glutamine-binding protein GlnH [Actinokineospora globicatena]